MSRIRIGAAVAGGALLVTTCGLAGLVTVVSHSSASQAASVAARSAASSTNTMDALSSATVNTAALVSPKVTLIQSAAGLGSGEIIDSRGYVVTNYHVLSGGKSNLAPPFTVTLSNGRTYPASVAGTDSADDLAVLRIKATGLKPIGYGDSSKLRVGQIVLAVGNPLGYAQTVTFGIVSTLGRGLPEGGPATYLPNLIQTSAPINPGNSGGALVDLNGNLVGIPTLAAQDPNQGTAAQGIGFAIPSNRVKFIADQVIKNGKVVNTGRAYLGISALDVTPDVQAQYNLPINHGVLVAQVAKDGPAAKAGLTAGEIITNLNSTAIDNNTTLLDVLSTLQPNKSVSLQVVGTNGSKHTVKVTLGTLPAGQ